MAFPKLRTNAVAQYPAAKSVRFENQSLRFLDGTAQRYRESSGPVHQWNIQLDLLDEGEMAALEQFFAAMQGGFGSFSFTDPWDGQVYPDCRFSSDALSLSSLDEMKGRASLAIVENRG